MRSSSIVQAIIEILNREDNHLSSQEIYDQVHCRLQSVNPSTVYRALDRMAGEGVVSVSDMGTGCKVYELVHKGLHHHLVCQRCGRVGTLSHEVIERFFSEIEIRQHFQVITNHLVLFGLCCECKK